MAALCTFLLLSSAGVAGAADTTVGGGAGVAYGTGSSAPKAENVAIGKMPPFPTLAALGSHLQAILLSVVVHIPITILTKAVVSQLVPMLLWKIWLEA